MQMCDYFKTWPYNIMAEVLTCEEYKVWKANIPDDFTETVDFVLTNLIQDKDADIIRKKLEAKLTYQKVAQELGLSNWDSARTRFNRACSALGRKPCKEILTKDLSVVRNEGILRVDHPCFAVSQLHLTPRARNALLLRGIYLIDQLIEHKASELAGMRNIGASSVRKIEENLQVYGLHLAPESVGSGMRSDADSSQKDHKLCIADLNLPKRAYNSLKRARIHTIAQLLEHSRRDLARIRNMGCRSLDVIEAKLQELGLYLLPDDRANNKKEN